MPKTVVKRSGAVVPFDSTRIERAVRLCLKDVGEIVSNAWLSDFVFAVTESVGEEPTVEFIQDTVERTLLQAGKVEAARSYIRYRDEHAKMRAVQISDETRAAFDDAATYFPSFLAQFQFFDKYARFDHTKGRRETWVEAIDRVVDFLKELSENRLESHVYAAIRDSFLRRDAMPSMRLLAMAGEAARRQNAATYNCSYVAVDHIMAFVETMALSLAGAGVGYSVEYQNVAKLPVVSHQMLTGKPHPVHQIEDTTEGWCFAWHTGLVTWFSGGDVTFDYSLLRPFGAPLKVKGGRASGPAPLKALLDNARKIIINAQGRQLTTLEAHRMMCMTGSAAVAGGTRRTAMIALFSHGDMLMRTCKDGNLNETPELWNANISECWPDRQLTQVEIAEFFLAMHKSRRGEPGIFSRRATINTLPARRNVAEFGTNPCAEVSLRPNGLCNLSSAVCRVDDTLDSLAQKVTITTIVGTIQSMATHLPGLRPEWRINAEEERLLGVDLNGQRDCAIVQEAWVMDYLQDIATTTNQKYAELLGINPSAAITCVKPSGNASVLLDSSSGLHARHAPYYIRRVRISASSPLFPVVRDAGVPMMPENGQYADTATTWVMSVPVKSPDGAVCRNDLSAVDQLDYWLRVKTSWCQHTASVTISYDDDEIIDVMQWVCDNQDVISGLSFLPRENIQYDQAPYEEIDRGTYERLAAEFPTNVDFARITIYEHGDTTTSSTEVACAGGACELSL
jgi:ribonucleoside-diphosphate reductase alpha chain